MGMQSPGESPAGFTNWAHLMHVDIRAPHTLWPGECCCVSGLMSWEPRSRCITLSADLLASSR